MFAFKPENKAGQSLSFKPGILAPDLHLSRLLPVGRKNLKGGQDEKQHSKKIMVITLIIAAVYSLLPALAQAAAPAKDKCFAEFERCTKEDVRTSFWGGFC